jgi:hypothetical protein
MQSMISYTKAAMERAMKVQEVILRAMAKKITCPLRLPVPPSRLCVEVLDFAV